MRLFFALWPPAAAAAALARWAGAVQRDAGGRATRAASIHLTLAFLGDVDAARLPRAAAAAREVNGAAHALPIDEASYWEHNRIVWVGPHKLPAALGALAEALRANLLGAGFHLEQRPFQAHITLLRRARAPRALPPLPVLEWPVAEYLLMRSELSAEGSRYAVLERFTLGA